jgi:hypothetical protein
MPHKTSKPINHWDKLDQILKHEKEPMGNEWFTAKDFCDRYGYLERTGHYKLKALVKEKKIEVWHGYSASIKHICYKYRII